MPCKVVSIHETEYSRFLFGIMAVFLLSMLCLPAFASIDPDPTDSRGDFYDWVVNQGGSFDGGRPDGSVGGGRYSKDDYDNFVNEVPATGITSAGRLLWQPTFADANANTSGYSDNYFRVSYYEGVYSRNVYLDAIPNCEAITIFSDNTGFTCTYSNSFFNICPDLSDSANVTLGTVQYHFPVYEVIPDSAIDTSAGGQYSVNTRPTTITGGNYGIIGDDGTINIVTNNSQIVNEINNTYYNPATGETQPILNWSYDYGDRTYSLGLEGNVTVDVCYGDKNITIKEGDTTYTIYYIVNGSGAGDECAHEWYQTGAKQGNCITPSQRTYTCSICKKQYTETDPVLGHSWYIIQTVPTKNLSVNS